MVEKRRSTLAKAALAALLACVLSFAGIAQSTPANTGQSPQNNAARKNRPADRQKRNAKMGDWLQNHKDTPPDQQEKLLENDPNFQKLPPARQAELRERLRKFNSLPPDKRDRALQRMQYMASLPQEQRQKVRDANQKLQTLPQDRQVMVHRAVRRLRQMSPQERQQTLQSQEFKSKFSDQEQQILKELADINPPGNGPQQAR